MKILLSAALLCLVGLAGYSARIQAEDEKTAPSPEALLAVIAEAGQPGEEHKKLEALAGEWTFTNKFWLDPSQPPLEAKGTIHREMILGGRFLEEKINAVDQDGKPAFEGRGLIGYDSGQKKYTASWVCSMGTSTCSGTGAAESGGFTFRTECYCPIQKKIVEGREVLRFESDNKTVAESYVTVDGKEAKIMEIVAERKK